MPKHDATSKSTFADDTAILSSNKDSSKVSKFLQEHINKLQTWLTNCKIEINEQKCVYVTFSLRKRKFHIVNINGVNIPQHK